MNTTRTTLIAALCLSFLLVACGGSDLAPYDPPGAWHGVFLTNGVEDSTFTLELEADRGTWRFDTSQGEGDVTVVVANARRVQLRLFATIGCRADLMIEAVVADDDSWSGTLVGETCERRYDGDVTVVRR